MNWGDVARAQSGAITRQQLRQAGLSDDRVDGLLAAAAVDALWPGLFLVRGAPRTYNARLWAAVLSTRGVLGFGTAAHLWGAVDESSRPDQCALWRDRCICGDNRTCECPASRYDRR